MATYDPIYQSPPIGPPSPGISQLKIAAIFIIVAASLSLVWGLVDGLGRVAIAAGISPMPAFAAQPGMDPGLVQFMFYLFLVLDVLAVLLSPIVIFGAIQMLRRKMYGFVKFTAILAMLPISTHCCCVLGLPMGIWALTILNRPDVRDAFREASL